MDTRTKLIITVGAAAGAIGIGTLIYFAIKPKKRPISKSTITFADDLGESTSSSDRIAEIAREIEEDDDHAGDLNTQSAPSENVAESAKTSPSSGSNPAKPEIDA